MNRRVFLVLTLFTCASYNNCHAKTNALTPFRWDSTVPFNRYEQKNVVKRSPQQQRSFHRRTEFKLDLNLPDMAATIRKRLHDAIDAIRNPSSIEIITRYNNGENSYNDDQGNQVLQGANSQYPPPPPYRPPPPPPPPPPHRDHHSQSQYGGYPPPPPPPPYGGPPPPYGHYPPPPYGHPPPPPPPPYSDNYSPSPYYPPPPPGPPPGPPQGPPPGPPRGPPPGPPRGPPPGPPQGPPPGPPQGPPPQRPPYDSYDQEGDNQGQVTTTSLKPLNLDEHYENEGHGNVIGYIENHFPVILLNDNEIR